MGALAVAGWDTMVLDGVLDEIAAASGEAGIHGRARRRVRSASRAMIRWVVQMAPASTDANEHVAVVREDEDLFVRSSAVVADCDADLLCPPKLERAVGRVDGSSLDITVDDGRLVCVLHIPIG